MLWFSQESGGAGGRKMSKAQKRKEAKQKADAEREERIEREKAEMGDSDRVLEEQVGVPRPAPCGTGAGRPRAPDPRTNASAVGLGTEATAWTGQPQGRIAPNSLPSSYERTLRLTRKTLRPYPAERNSRSSYFHAAAHRLTRASCLRRRRWRPSWRRWACA
jgi:hypothetical protein